ncbi:hypothetical protein NM208_g14963 [Fusarium decemcellulare]|uniref:Uncharacterized protein n=1 Tax=Fusarium decemcellulare TaxID=57161 RepID=A0ACC1REH5_9HYPO|nr:hypothetical protein NM208_g14963 [Fusarium decemcellulare]
MLPHVSHPSSSSDTPINHPRRDFGFPTSCQPGSRRLPALNHLPAPVCLPTPPAAIQVSKSICDFHGPLQLDRSSNYSGGIRSTLGLSSFLLITHSSLILQGTGDSKRLLLWRLNLGSRSTRHYTVTLNKQSYTSPFRFLSVYYSASTCSNQWGQAPLSFEPKSPRQGVHFPSSSGNIAPGKNTTSFKGQLTSPFLECQCLWSGSEPRITPLSFSYLASIILHIGVCAVLDQISENQDLHSDPVLAHWPPLDKTSSRPGFNYNCDHFCPRQVVYILQLASLNNNPFPTSPPFRQLECLLSSSSVRPTSFSRLESPDTLTLRYEEAARAANGGDPRGDSPPRFLEMATYTKAQLPSMHAGYDANRYQDAGYEQYPAQSFPTQQQTDKFAQLNQQSFASNNAAVAQYMAPGPTVLSCQPTTGMFGTKVFIKVSSQYDLFSLSSPMPSWILQFGSERCTSQDVSRDVQDSSGFLYTCSGDAPQFLVTGCPSSSVPLSLILEAPSGEEISRTVVGTFQYLEGSGDDITRSAEYLTQGWRASAAI